MKPQGYAAVLGALLMVTPLAHADILDTLGWDRTRPDIKKLSTLYVGGGFANSFIYASAETPTPYGNVYARVGQYYKGDGVAGQLGWRYPYAYTGVDKNGYYLGGFIGHIKDDVLDGERYNRLGGGVELSYLSLRNELLASGSVALAFGESKTSKDGSTQRKTTPMIIFAANFNVGLF
jgi:hypothetical protein